MDETLKLKTSDLFFGCAVELEELEAKSDGKGALWKFTVSDETPVDRYFGKLILDHAPKSVDLERYKNRAAVRDEHYGDQIGVIEGAAVKDKKLWVQVRFSQDNPRAALIEADMRNGIRSNVSVGIVPGERVLEREDNGSSTYRMKTWTPVHLAIVADPANPNVGVGRLSHEASEEFEFSVTGGPAAISTEGNKMEEKELLAQQVAAAAAAAAAKSPAGDNGNVAVLEAEHRKKGASEAMEIFDIAKKNGWTEEDARALSQSGLSNIDARLKIFEKHQDGLAAKTPQPKAEAIDGLSEKDRRRYSIGRAIKLAVFARDGGKIDGLEGEMHRHLEKNQPDGTVRRGGVYVPLRLKSDEQLYRELDERTERFTMGTTEPGQAVVVGTQYMDLIDYLINSALVLQFGAQFYPGMTSAAYWAKETGLPTVYWMDENPATGVPESESTFDYVEATPKTLMGNMKFSRQLLTMSQFDLDALGRRRLGDGHGLALDRAALVGPGTNKQPLGIYNAPGVQVVDISPAGVPTYGDLIDATVKPAKKNVKRGGMRWMSEPGVAGKFLQTQLVTGQSQMLWNGTVEDGVLGGYRASTTNQIPDTLGAAGDESGLIFGDWSTLAVLMWGNSLELVYDPYTKADFGQIRIISFSMADVVLLRPEAFVKFTGVKVG